MLEPHTTEKVVMFDSSGKSMAHEQYFTLFTNEFTEKLLHRDPNSEFEGMSPESTLYDDLL